MNAPATPDPRPAWVREIDMAIRMYPQLILTGNVHDIYLLDDPNGQRWEMSLADVVWFTLRQQGFAALLTYTRTAGLQIVADKCGGCQPDATRVLEAVPGLKLGEPMSWDMLYRLVQAITAVAPGVDPGPPVALMLPDAGRMFNDPPDEEQRTFLTAAAQIAYSAVKFRPSYPAIIWVTDQPGELPGWFASHNHAIRTTVVPMPDRGARLEVCQAKLSRLPGYPSDHDAAHDAVETFADLTHGLHTRAIRDISALAHAHQVPATSIGDAVRAYRVGVPDNPWIKPDLRAQIKRADTELSERVLGQPDAVMRALDLLKRAAIGLGGAQMRSRSTRPRGVLFFAGPTGVGKTELAKAIAQIVFGDDNAYLRFDMSEFAAEQNEARLIGAPPGYIGHDAGGELTNGVRSRPFQVILFDEIEKAHPLILDKFLQILDDGRLTDGRGATVPFTESIIVFTTNMGIIVPGPDGKPVLNVKPGDPPADIDTKVRHYIELYFRETLGRPELYNRLREGIVVFNFLPTSILEQIADSSITRTLSVASTRYGAPITISRHAREGIITAATADPSNGGRGVVSAIDTVLINPLSRALFDRVAEAVSPVVIEQAKQLGQNWELELR
jgi:ATP-dependent Clp protease ATP-binding subunit ClpB